mmetsp:Transcript_98492/g.274102  ORF Transcript_98492/g.274102 Transcript_98492/m.274102 type:complete len:245 (+) Transcript_98492:3-737(+)
MGAMACSPTDVTVECVSSAKHRLSSDCVHMCADVANPTAWSPEIIADFALLRASADGDLAMASSALRDGAVVDTRKRPLMRPRVEVPSDETGPDSPSEVLELDFAGRVHRRGERPCGLRGIGLTPLMLAAQAGSPSVVRLLLKSQARPNLQDEDGMTPLHFAAKAACQECCEQLLAAGACDTATDDDARDAFDWLPTQAVSTRADRCKWEQLLRPADSAPCGGIAAGGAAEAAAVLSGARLAQR